jgi:hypothetical protein
VLENVYEQDFFGVVELEPADIAADVGLFRVRVHVRPALQRFVAAAKVEPHAGTGV